MVRGVDGKEWTAAEGHTSCFARDPWLRKVVDMRLTEGGRVASRTTLQCSIIVSKVGAQASITHVRVRRTARLAKR